MLEPYTINTGAMCITTSIARMALAHVMRDGLFYTIKDWRVSPEQEASIHNIAITITSEVKVAITKEDVDRVKALLEKYPLTTFCGFPLTVDPAVDRDKIELRDKDDNVLVRIVSLAIPYSGAM